MLKLFKSMYFLPGKVGVISTVPVRHLRVTSRSKRLGRIDAGKDGNAKTSNKNRGTKLSDDFLFDGEEDEEIIKMKKALKNSPTLSSLSKRKDVDPEAFLKELESELGIDKLLHSPTMESKSSHPLEEEASEFYEDMGSSGPRPESQEELEELRETRSLFEKVVKAPSAEKAEPTKPLSRSEMDSLEREAWRDSGDESDDFSLALRRRGRGANAAFTPSRRSSSKTTPTEVDVSSSIAASQAMAMLGARGMALPDRALSGQGAQMSQRASRKVDDDLVSADD